MLICLLMSFMSFSAYRVEPFRKVQYLKISLRCLAAVSVQTIDFLAIQCPLYQAVPSKLISLQEYLVH